MLTRREKAKQRVENARFALRRALAALENEDARYLRAAGWERVVGGLAGGVWKRGARLYTTWAAVRDQERRDRNAARRKAAK